MASNLQSLFARFAEKGRTTILAKTLSANDNSKNQVYFGKDFSILNVFPLKEIEADASVKANSTSPRYKTKLQFYWLNEDNTIFKAPKAQLILYPEYPEVRFSGFLDGCDHPPSELMTARTPGRILFLGILPLGWVMGYVSEPDSNLSIEYANLEKAERIGVFEKITLLNGHVELQSKKQLLNELLRIHRSGWINAKKLDPAGAIEDCLGTNCGGYTLEAELGITPNGYSEPDYLGWEIKQFGVKSFQKWTSAVVTLMTPEPTHGLYKEKGVEEFILKYGYLDKLGREARQNFGGIHKFGEIQKTTGLRLMLDGYDPKSNKLIRADGSMALVDKNDAVAASWSFTSLLKHWNTKHSNACYVPSKKQSTSVPGTLISKTEYCYGESVLLGEGTDFLLLLKQIANGNIYYDPGIKLEHAIEGIRSKKIKKRSQFRIKSTNITALYKKSAVTILGEK